MILIKIDKTSSIPLFKQITNQIKDLIENNSLKQGDHLPSTRLLASQLGLNRTTVYKAYEELWALGYIESKSGSYSTIRKRTKEISSKEEVIQDEIDWNSKLSKASKILIEEDISKITPKDNNCIDFRPLSPDLSVIPNNEYRKCINSILIDKNEDVFFYGDSMGYNALRKSLANHLNLHGIKINSNEIIITNGAQSAIGFIFKLLLEPKSEIIIESPTYSSIIPLIRSFNLKVIEIPMNAEGMDLDILKSKINNRNPKLLYTMPNFQNPTGITSSQSHREKLLSICEQNNIPIIEDGFVEEMKYFGKSVLPIKSMDKKGIVFYIGTFSKVLFPGIRIGWIASNQYCTKRLSEIIKTIEISVNTINQVALNSFMEKGYLNNQLLRIHRLYKKRMGVALKVIRENLTNKNVDYTKPIGGYTIWFDILNVQLTENELLTLFGNENVLVSSGSISYYSKSNKLNFRISIAHCSEHEIENGLIRIINILNSLI